MSEKLKFNSLLQEIKEIYLLLTEGEPSPDDEIEARENFIRFFKNLKLVTSDPKLEILIDECLDKLEKWDVLELWFVEVPGLKKLIKQILDQAGIELPAQQELITPTQEKVEFEPIKKERDVDVEEVVEKITEQFTSQINDLKKEIERLQQELKKGETPSESIRRELKEELKELKIMKKRGESPPIKKPKLSPPEIKLPRLKITKTPPKIASEKGESEDLFSKRLKKIQDIAAPFKLAVSKEKKGSQEDIPAAEEESQNLQQIDMSSEKEQVFLKEDSEIQEPIEKMVPSPSPASEEVEDAPEEINPEILKTPENINTKTQDLLNLEETLKKLEELENLDTLESEKEVGVPEAAPINELVQKSSEDFPTLELNEIEAKEIPSILPEPSLIPPPPPKTVSPPEELSPVPQTPFKEIEHEEDLSPIPKKPQKAAINVETPPSRKMPKISFEIKEEPIESKPSESTPFVEPRFPKEKKIPIVPEVIEESIEAFQPEKPPFIPETETEIKTEEPVKKEEPLSQPFNLIELGKKLESKTAESSNSIKTTKIDLFEAFTSVGKKQVKKSEKGTEFFNLSRQKKLVKEESKSEQISPPPFFKGIGAIKKESPEVDIIPINIDELPRDKDKLYQELIVHEGKRYKLEKLYKEVEDKHERGMIDDLEFKNEIGQLKKKLNLITEIINGIRQVISTL